MLRGEEARILCAKWGGEERVEGYAVLISKEIRDISSVWLTKTWGEIVVVADRYSRSSTGEKDKEHGRQNMLFEFIEKETGEDK